MRHRKHTVRFGRQRSHYKATLHHIVSSLVINKAITTTKIRAKQASRLAEKLVTIAKNNVVANRRRAYAILRDRTLVSILFNEIAPLFKDRNGGYTRVMLTERRRGDNAQMAMLEFIEKPEKKTEPKAEIGKKEKILQPKAKKEEVIRKKEEGKKTTVPPKKPEKPREQAKPRPGFFKKLFGRKKGK